MITPRQTRLVRVPDLHRFRSSISALIKQHRDAFSISPLVVVPTHGAGEQLLKCLGGEPVTPITRDELYDALQARLAPAPRRLNAYERTAMMQAAAATEAADVPFTVRPGLVAEMVRFYDHLRRQGQSVHRFEELMTAALAGGADVDRGAERLLRQTRFLAASFRRYEQAVAANDACDEHRLRQRLIAEASLEPIASIVVTVADWIADPDGLFVVDFDLLSRVPHLQCIDLVCTEAVLESGFHERIHGWWPGIEEVDGSTVGGRADSAKPRLLTPAEGDVWFTCRDREEELVLVARRVASRAKDRAATESTAVVFKRPLPYLYLAGDVFGAAGIAYETVDALPLAAEPIAAVVDLVLEALETRFTRIETIALLRSPHLAFDGGPAPRVSISRLDRQLSALRYLGELEHLEALASVWNEEESRPALDRALALTCDLSTLLQPAPASVQLRALVSFVERRCPEPTGDSPVDEPERRARTVILDTLRSLAAAHERFHDVKWSIADLAGAVRRAIGDQTFHAPSSATPIAGGVQLVDDRAARYTACADVALVGLVEGDWPEPPRRNIFYSASLLKALGWPSEKDRRAAADARFVDLLGSASTSVSVSTILLDDETLVTRSTQLDEIPRARLSTVAEQSLGADPLTAADALIAGDLAWPRYDEESRGWLAMRAARTAAADADFHGFAGAQPPRMWSVSALETYIDCPFKFYARHVLGLDEEPDDEEVMDPRRRGQFVHEVFEAFFTRWQQSGHAAITRTNMDEARAQFAAVADERLQQISSTEAALERTRLLGSSAAAGLGESVFRMEAERDVPVVERRLEFDLRGEFDVTTAAGSRRVSLRGRVDRLDLLSDGTFRVIDYKLGWPPKRDRALQLPIYGVCAEQRLAQERSGRTWRLGEAMYIAFKGPKRVVPLFSSDAARADVLTKAQQRLADTIDAIGRGEFPPTPDDVFRCETCSFARVCRKDYV